MGKRVWTVNIQELMTIASESFPHMEEQLGREMTSKEKYDVVAGVINKWNEANPNNWIVIPAAYLKD